MARLAAMLAAACFSFYLIERPLRRADWRRLRGRLHVPAPSFALAGLCATAVLIVGGTVGPRGAGSANVSLSALPSDPAPSAARAPDHPAHLPSISPPRASISRPRRQRSPTGYGSWATA